MTNSDRYGRVLRAVSRFLFIFTVAAFLITCSITLFVTVMTNTLGIVLSDADVEVAAKLTFLNVIGLSLLFTAIDTLRKRITVEMPAKRITDAAEKIMKGDFSVRIPRRRTRNAENEFNEIADCFNRMAEELSNTETLRTDFIANVSHELKTPLAVIRNYATMLENPALPASERTEYARAISDASLRLAALVTNILKLNKLENRQIAFAKRAYDLSSEVAECLLSFEDAWEKKGIDIETNIEDGVRVKSDPEMMCLVWNNLISNAIKFTKSGGRVTVSVRSDGAFATVTVRDTGCGISPEVGKHIFDKFYQGDTSHATEGNGLGLALVRRIVDLAGCNIEVESAVGEGTAFTVRMHLEA